MSKRTRFYATIFGMLGICMCCAFAIILTYRGNEKNNQPSQVAAELPAPSPTPEPTATNTPAPPANTPVPTPTSVPPTPTRKPTNTPIPESKDSIPPDIQIYRQGIIKQIGTLGDAMTAIGELLKNPDVGNDKWRINLALQITFVRVAHEELTKMDVPPEMKEIHEAILDGTSDCNEAMDYIVTGIDNVNIDDIITAQALMVRCGDKMEKPTTMVGEYFNQ